VWDQQNRLLSGTRRPADQAAVGPVWDQQTRSPGCYLGPGEPGDQAAIWDQENQETRLLSGTRRPEAQAAIWDQETSRPGCCRPGVGPADRVVSTSVWIPVLGFLRVSGFWGPASSLLKAGQQACFIQMVLLLLLLSSLMEYIIVRFAPRKLSLPQKQHGQAERRAARMCKILCGLRLTLT